MTYLIATMAGIVTCSAVALVFSGVPFLWIGLTWSVAGLVIACMAPRVLKLPSLLGASFAFSFGLGELIVPPPLDLSYLPDPYRHDDLLGWSLDPSQVSRATAKIGGQPIYDVTYSTDAAGLPVSPPDRGDQVEGCLVFLTDSFTFGEGVADDQTFPYHVGLQTNGRFRVANLSFPGYGAEHMLAAIQKGVLATDPPCEPTHAFYAALPDHIYRAAGKTPFSAFGPRYRLASKGLVYLGTNANISASLEPRGLRRWLELVRKQLRKSRLLRYVRGHRPQATEDDIALYFAIVQKAVRLFKRRWPGAEVHVISWDIHKGLLGSSFFPNGQAIFHSELEEMPTQVHFIDEIIPGYSQDPAKYQLHELDFHPNPLAHKLVGSYIAQRVLSPDQSAKRKNAVAEHSEQQNRADPL